MMRITEFAKSYVWPAHRVCEWVTELANVEGFDQIYTPAKDYPNDERPRVVLSGGYYFADAYLTDLAVSQLETKSLIEGAKVANRSHLNRKRLDPGTPPNVNVHY